MNYLEFKEKFFNLAYINMHQIYAWQPAFDRNNITRWQKKGLLVKLRQGYYSFPEYKKSADISFYFANRIYQPSYISLYTALSFYGIIPETVNSITSVTTLKTITFKNELAEYTYSKIRENLFFGFDLKPMPDGRAIQFALAEKAILDLLYLYPFYNTEQELQELRFDEDFMHNILNLNLLNELAIDFRSKALEKRVKQLILSYNL
jgi:predicted transcriptional regulator of viral defense system